MEVGGRTNALQVDELQRQSRNTGMSLNVGLFRPLARPSKFCMTLLSFREY